MTISPRILFLGTRDEILKKILELNLNLTYAIVVEDSFAHKFILHNSIPHSIIDKETKEEMFQLISNLDFDLAVSCGFPFIIPIDDIKKERQVFINFHPSILPKYIGLHPVNGVLLNNESYTGITCHYIDAGMDTGNIVYQHKVPLTSDIDADLLYQILFRIEGEVFEKAYEILKKHNFNWEGIKQKGEPSVYFRKKNQRIISFSQMAINDILRIIRAFSNPRLGALGIKQEKSIKILSGSEIVNPLLVEKYSDSKPGTILFKYSQSMLIKALDGIIRINSYHTDDSFTEGEVLN